MKKLEFEDLDLFYGNKEEITSEIAKQVSPKDAEQTFDTMYVTRSGREKALLFVIGGDKKDVKIGIQRHLISNAILEAADLTEDQCDEAGFHLAQILTEIDEELGL